MSTVTAKLSWVASTWKNAWNKIPFIMAGHCLSTPLVLGYLIYIIVHPEFLRTQAAEKYRDRYTVMRSDDSRVARINKYCSDDKMGIFS